MSGPQGDLVATRAWSAKCFYPGKKLFYLGTVCLPFDAKVHEVDAALLALWASLSPHPAPYLLASEGQVIFVPAGDA